MRARSAVLAVVTTLLAVAAFSSPASAATYCLYVTDCNGVPANVRPATQQGLASAISAAQSSMNEDDTIEIGSTPIDIDTTIEASATSTNNLIIKAAPGADAVLHFTHTGDAGLYFDAVGTTASTVENLTAVLDGASVGDRSAIELHGGRATDVKFDVKSPSGQSAYGLVLFSSAQCVYCTFNLFTDDTYGVYATGGAQIVNADFYDADPSFADSTGVLAGPGAGDVMIRNSKFIAVNTGLKVSGETVELRDSVIDMGDNEDAQGILVGLDENQTGASYATIDGVTIVGAANGQRALDLDATTTSPSGETADAYIINTLFKLTGSGTSEVSCIDDGGFGVVSVAMTNAFKRVTTPSAIGCQQINGGGNLPSTDFEPEELFVNWEDGDLR
ncbi:MAG: hypothetical protein ACRDKE_10860, partial [Solirubrobacterales bacterium]